VCWDTLCQTCVFASSVIYGSRSVFTCVWGVQCRRTIFYAQVGLIQILGKARPDTLCRTWHPGQSMGHAMHFGAFKTWNVDALFFILGWNWCGCHKMRTGTRYAEHMFLHPMWSADHVVHWVRPGCKTSLQFFWCLGGPKAHPIKSMSEKIMPNFCFCFRCDLRVK
jgi:hypothetical protein